MRAGNHLAAADAPQRARVLLRRADAVRTVAWDAGVVADERLDIAEHSAQGTRHAMPQDARIPDRRHDRLLQTLADGTRLVGVWREALGHRRDALALVGQKQPRGVPPQRPQPLDPTQPAQPLAQVHLQLPIQLRNPFSRHEHAQITDADRRPFRDLSELHLPATDFFPAIFRVRPRPARKTSLLVRENIL